MALASSAENNKLRDYFIPGSPKPHLELIVPPSATDGGSVTVSSRFGGSRDIRTQSRRAIPRTESFPKQLRWRSGNRLSKIGLEDGHEAIPQTGFRCIHELADRSSTPKLGAVPDHHHSSPVPPSALREVSCHILIYLECIQHNQPKETTGRHPSGRHQG